MDRLPRARSFDRWTRCQWGIYAITDRVASGNRPMLETVAAALKGGIRVIQLRDKNMAFEDLVAVGREIRRLTRQFGATFIVNDNPYLAIETDADGVHLGQEDIPVEVARDIVGPDMIIGLSTHTREQALMAQLLPVDYIGVGPVYATNTKSSPWPVVGTEMVRWARLTVSLPLVAIGGITADRVPEVVAAGAHNIAIIRDLMSASDITARAAHLRQIFEQSRAA
ncbi:MAG: thiamine phosphate synthase [Candidatus Sumerlaeaceae bacterium]|nr:thiamine phosphate synthase [Candidatus Sumerlaeaceae bacterium]